MLPEFAFTHRRPGTDGVAQRLGKALREYGVANKDPHLSKAKISASLDWVLRTEIEAKEADALP